MKLLAAILALSFSFARAETPFSVAHWSDCHTGAFCNATNAQQLVSFVTSHTNDGDLNFKGMVLTGDIFEQQGSYYVGGGSYDSNKWQFSTATNALNGLLTNGLFVVACNGNHDADDFGGAGGSWTGNHTNSTDYSWASYFTPGFFSNQTALTYLTNAAPADARQMAVAYVNQGVKLLFVSYSSSYTNDGGNYTVPVDIRSQFAPQTLWISNQITAHPDHNAVVLAHYMLAHDAASFNIGGLQHWARPYPFLSLNDYNYYRNIGPSLIAFEQGLGACSNLMAFLSGHTQSMRKGHLAIPRATGGAIDVQCFNMQQATAAEGLLNGQAVSVLTFYPDTKKMRVRTFNTGTGTEIQNWATNFVKFGTGPANEVITNVYEHTWTVPLAVPRQKRVFRL